MQNVLGFSAIQTGLAYLPLCFAVVIAAGDHVAAVVARRHEAGDRDRRRDRCGRSLLLSRIPAAARTLADLLPGLLRALARRRAVFVGVVTAANAGVPADKAGLAAALLNASQQLGGALGLAILTAVASSRTQHTPRGRTPCRKLSPPAFSGRCSSAACSSSPRRSSRCARRTPAARWKGSRQSRRSRRPRSQPETAESRVARWALATAAGGDKAAAGRRRRRGGGLRRSDRGLREIGLDEQHVVAACPVDDGEQRAHARNLFALLVQEPAEEVLADRIGFLARNANESSRSAR